MGLKGIKCALGPIGLNEWMLRQYGAQHFVGFESHKRGGFKAVKQGCNIFIELHWNYCSMNKNTLHEKQCS